MPVPRLIDPVSRGDTIAEAAWRVIVAGGIPALTLRAVAAEARISPASLVHQFTDRARLMTTLCVRHGHDRLDTISRRTLAEGAFAFLPTGDTVSDERVWLAWCELGRSDPPIGEAVAAVRREERDMLDVVLRRSLDEPGLDALRAVIDGLVVAMCSGDEPVSSERAKAALARALRSAS